MLCAADERALLSGAACAEAAPDDEVVPCLADEPAQTQVVKHMQAQWAAEQDPA